MWPVVALVVGWVIGRAATAHAIGPLTSTFATYSYGDPSCNVVEAGADLGAIGRLVIPEPE